MGLIQRRAPVKWNDLDFTEFQTPNNPFSEFATWLTPLNITPDNALIFFSIDYEEALTEYSEIMIGTIMHAVAAANAKKYDKLIAAYTAQYDPLDEYSDTDGYTDTRTPNLTQNSTGGATVEDVALMRRTVGEDMGVKAAGGVRDKETFEAMIKAGATRIGTSSGKNLI